MEYRLMSEQLSQELAVCVAGCQWPEAAKTALAERRANGETYGEQHPNTLRSLRILASIYQAQGRWVEATLLQKRIADATEAEPGNESLASLESQLVFQVDQGSWSLAERNGESMLDLSVKLFGMESQEALKSMNQLALIYNGLEKWSLSRELKLKELEIKQTLFGPDDPSTLNCQVDLATIFAEEGRLEDARHLFQTVLDKRKSRLPSDHPDTLHCMSQMASMYYNNQLWKEAEELQKTVFAAMLRTVGEQDPCCLNAMDNLAQTFTSEGKWSDAEQLQIRILDANQKILPADHPETISALAQLSSTYEAQKRFEEAKDLLKQVVHKQRFVLTEFDLARLDCMARLLNLTENDEDYSLELLCEFEEVSRELVSGFVESPVDLIKLDVGLMLSRSALLIGRGQLDQAEDMLVDAREVATGAIGHEDPVTHTTVEFLDTFYAMGQQQTSEEENHQIAEDELGLHD
ncbi:kinesin light chain [Aspergillus udagawae]|nr:kinesin light chain [Aspergillus udagawae]